MAVNNWRPYGRGLKTRSRLLPSIVFVIYLCMMAYYLFFASSLGRGTSGEYHYNFHPFHEILRYVHYSEFFDWKLLTMNLVGNVVAFMPLGYFLPRLFERNANFFMTLIACADTSLLVEVLQILTKTGSFDVDDILLNTIGGCFGYILYVIIDKIIIYKDNHS